MFVDHEGHIRMMLSCEARGQTLYKRYAVTKGQFENDGIEALELSLMVAIKELEEHVARVYR
jgi:hypothetical protein